MGPSALLFLYSLTTYHVILPTGSAFSHSFPSLSHPPPYTRTHIVCANTIEIMPQHHSVGVKAWALVSDGVDSLAAFPISHATLAEVLNLSKPQFPHLQKGGESISFARWV